MDEKSISSIAIRFNQVTKSFSHDGNHCQAAKNRGLPWRVCWRMETKSHRAEIITILSLGGTPKQSIVEFLKQAITSISLGFLSFSTLFNENDQFIIGSN